MCPPFGHTPPRSIRSIVRCIGQEGRRAAQYRERKKKRPQEARPEAAPNSLRRAGGNALPLSKVAIL
jgi:hypothetical protein